MNELIPQGLQKKLDQMIEFLAGKDDICEPNVQLYYNGSGSWGYVYDGNFSKTVIAFKHLEATVRAYCHEDSTPKDQDDSEKAEITALENKLDELIEKIVEKSGEMNVQLSYNGYGGKWGYIKDGEFSEPVPFENLEETVEELFD